ncbi:MAG: 5-(carboxyamino)imidazole ribonucleotide mutase [bacterium]|nr:5-(carboxyamino)imidazole ribonucleotide mutase [bacterium]
MGADIRVSIIMGSKSDDEHMKPTYDLLDRFEIGWEKRVLSAHRQPDALLAYVKEKNNSNVQVFVTAAGLAAALPGVVAAHTIRPVIGVPVPGGPLNGMDALLSIVQMPGGIPVATVGLGSNGPKNAAMLCVHILALSDDGLRSKLVSYRDELSRG